MNKFALAVLIAACVVNAASISWTGFGKDGEFGNPLNWNGDKVPTVGDDVTITTGSVTVTGNHEVNSLAMGMSVDGMANVTFLGSFYVSSTMEVDVNGNVFVNAGAANVAGTVTIGGGLYFQSGTIQGQWTIANRATADFTGAAQKTLSACELMVKGDMTLGGVLTLNQSSKVTVSSTVVASGNVFIQQGDSTSVLFDSSSGTFTYNGMGTMQVMAPMSMGTFNYVAGNLSLYDNLQFVNSFAIPQGSYVATVGSAVVSMTAGLTGSGVLSAAGKNLVLGGVSFEGDFNLIGGNATISGKSSIAVITVKGGYLITDATLTTPQLNILGGLFVGTGNIAATNGLIQTTGSNLAVTLSFSGNVATMGKSLIAFTGGSLKLMNGSMMNVGGSLLFTGAPGPQFTNDGTITVANPFTIQNILFVGDGSVVASAKLTLSSTTLQQNAITLSGSGMVEGSYTSISSIASVSATPGVEAIFGAYTTTCTPACTNVKTEVAPLSASFRFMVSQ